MTVLDIIPVAVILLIFSIGTVIGLSVWSNVETMLNATLSDNEVKTAVLNQTERAILGFDYAFVFLVFGLGISIILACLYLNLHPAFLVISIIGLAFSVWASAEFSNIFLALGASADLQAATNQFPLMVHIWNNFPTIMLFIGVIAMIAIYGRWGSGGGGP